MRRLAENSSLCFAVVDVYVCKKYFHCQHESDCSSALILTANSTLGWGESLLYMRMIHL
jgi:hypothetical protein